VAAKHHPPPARARGQHGCASAIADPLDTDGIDALGYMVKLAIEPVVATAAEIADAIDRFYGKDANSIDELLNDLSVSRQRRDGRRRDRGRAPRRPGRRRPRTDAPIVKLVHQRSILEAIHRRASDIHVEPLEKRFRVRVPHRRRVASRVENPPKRLQLAIISRLKIMADI
jgi:general secretion pathway protein E/type IV pilus assembly protein PilB